MKHSIVIKDDFCPQLDEVRESAHASGFGTWRPNKGEVGSSVYEGMNFIGNHDHMLRALSEALSCPVFPRLITFRITKPDTEGAYYHSDRDSGDWTCIVYMTDHKEVSGTGFFRHRKTGWLEMPSMNELRKTPAFFEELKRDMVSGDESKWEMTDMVRGHVNRALIFRAPLFHARVPKHGLGDGSDKTARMIWACHFYI